MRSLLRGASATQPLINLAAMGDSIGYGFEIGGPTGGNSPPEQAAAKLLLLGYPTRIRNVCVPGSTSSDGVTEYTGTVAPLFDPLVKHNVLVVEYGTNDAYQSIAEATYRANQQSLVASGRATGFKVVVWPPGHDFSALAPAGYEASIEANNNYWLTQVGTGCDGLCSWYLDAAFSTINSPGWNSAGDVHPNAFGAGVIATGGTSPGYLVGAVLHSIGLA